MDRLIAFYKKYKEGIIYIVFGALTTAVNLIVFYALEMLFGTENSYLYNNAIAWVAAVVFAYITNKLIVFESKSWEPSVVTREVAEFVGARLFSFGIEELGLWIFIDLLAFSRFSFKIIGFTITGGLIAKVILSVIVIILNYFFSKYIIFKDKKENK